ncbi:kinase-like protein [Gigaspora margarita]|uniref:Kinase-like protein n=1 Tax=Gigaspora margarita TaxID=4874 RepID=A0A8H3X1V0_GIGMA|nr:kinase-like protein [Gigaspora margarita]
MENIAKSYVPPIAAVGEAVKPYIPLIAAVTCVISEIFKIYENVQHNLNICNSLMDRVNVAESAIKSLERRKVENEKRFRDKEYYQRLKKYIQSSSVKERFENLIKELDDIMSELHFTIAIAHEEQRRLDQEGLNKDIADMKEFLQEIKGGIINSQNMNNYVLQEVQLLKNKIENDASNIDLPNSNEIKANFIDPESLREPEFPDSNRRGKNH